MVTEEKIIKQKELEERDRHTILQNLIKMLEVIHDNISMFFENGQSDKEVKAAAEPICPKRLPQPQDIDPFKFSFVPHKQHPEEEEEVRAISSLKMEIELWIH